MIGTLGGFLRIYFDGFQRGVIDGQDLVFFLSVIGFALFAIGVIIRGHRSEMMKRYENLIYSAIGLVALFSSDRGEFWSLACRRGSTLTEGSSHVVRRHAQVLRSLDSAGEGEALHLAGRGEARALRRLPARRVEDLVREFKPGPRTGIVVEAQPNPDSEWRTLRSSTAWKEPLAPASCSSASR